VFLCQLLRLPTHHTSTPLDHGLLHVALDAGFLTLIQALPFHGRLQTHLTMHLLMKWLLRLRHIGNLDPFHELRSLIFLLVRVFEGHHFHRLILHKAILIAFLILLLEHSKPLIRMKLTSSQWHLSAEKSSPIWVFESPLFLFAFLCLKPPPLPSYLLPACAPSQQENSLGSKLRRAFSIVKS
jgi:hypothetical protein